MKHMANDTVNKLAHLACLCLPEELECVTSHPCVDNDASVDSPSFFSSDEAYGSRAQPAMTPGKPNHDEMGLNQQERPSSLPRRDFAARSPLRHTAHLDQECAEEMRFGVKGKRRAMCLCILLTAALPPLALRSLCAELSAGYWVLSLFLSFSAALCHRCEIYNFCTNCIFIAVASGCSVCHSELKTPLMWHWSSITSTIVIRPAAERRDPGRKIPDSTLLKCRLRVTAAASRLWGRF
ncbi:AT-rich interactive domain-containing protein 1B isoform X1 [Tachysurus ichikawai]